MSTIVDALIGACLAPETVERMKSPEIAFAAFVKDMEKWFEPIGAATLAVAKSPPSPGYEPFFVRRGVDPVLARMMARLLVRRGRRIEAESQRHREVVEAVQFLAKPARKRSSIACRAGILLAAWDETSIIEAIFDRASLNRVMEFVEALKGAASGEDIGRQRAFEIATILLPYLSNPPGPKISAASAAHEFFLEDPGGVAMLHGYTWSDLQDDFVDEATEATRREFSDDDFDPRPAYRRLKARRRATMGLRRVGAG